MKDSFLKNKLLAIFILSGFSGLIYQSIWSHYLGGVLGHAAYAQALVLTIFMGGMAIGAAWVAYKGQSWVNLIKGYALVELVIGVLGLVFHWVFVGVLGFTYDGIMPSIDSPLLVDVLRWSISAILILPQTILLGMTFPLMSGGLIRQYPERQGELLGGLYFTNSIGAAIGALVAVFLLIPNVGLQGAIVIAGVVNILVALLAYMIANQIQPPAVKKVMDEAEQKINKNPLLQLVLLGTALSGAASFAYEIIWIRMLSMAVGSTMQAFELMLASFILGIALGGLWVKNKADRVNSPLYLVGWMQVLMGLAALISLFVYANSFEWVGWLMSSLTKTDGGYSIFNAGTAFLSILIMLPAAFFAGTTLPLFTLALLRAGLGERSIGRVYAWNTIGSIFGVFVAIHFLIPSFGLKYSLVIAAIVDMGIGIFLIKKYGSVKWLTVSVSLVFFFLIFAVRVNFDPLKMASGVFRHGAVSLAEDSKVIYLKDGKTASVSVAVFNNGAVSIATNGKPDASIMLKEGEPPTHDEAAMTFLGALPLALHENPEHIGVIGFGSGMSTHVLLGDQRVKRVDTIEIEKAMVEGAHAFGEFVNRAYRDKRSNIVIDDAKAYFSGGNKKYDVIVSEPSNPWISGVGSLFSKEFYKFIPKHLNSNGLFVQWVQLYEIDESLMASILNGLTPEFSDYSAWLVNRSDLVIIATPNGKLPELNYADFLSNATKKDLGRFRVDGLAQLQYRKIADANVLRGLGNLYGTMPVNSDFYPVLSLNAPKARFKQLSASEIMELPRSGPPLLEALGIRKPLQESEAYHASHFSAESDAVYARKVIDRIQSKNNNTNVQNLDSVIILHDLLKEYCSSSKKVGESLFSQIKLISDITIPYIPKDGLSGVWSTGASWVPCPMREDMHSVFSLLNPLANRDYKEMYESGSSWFNSTSVPPYVRNSFDQVALSNILLSLAHERRWADLKDAEAKYGKNVNSTGKYFSQRMLLLAMADK